MHPDIIFLVPLAKAIDVVACHKRGSAGHTVLWQERVSVSASGEVTDQLRPIFFRHPIRIGTPTILMVSPEIGGFLLQPSLARDQRDRAWAERQLALALPFATSDVDFRIQYSKGLAEIFWVPSSWIRSQVDALGKLGLKLEEIYPRAALFRQEASVADSTPSLLREEAGGGGGAIHIFVNGLVRRTAQLPAEPDAAENQIEMERMALEGDAALSSAVPRLACLPPETAQGESLAARLLALWLDGSDAIYINKGRGVLWAPALKVSFASCLLALLVIGGLEWRISALEESLQSANREFRALSPAIQRSREVEQTIAPEKNILAAVKTIDESPFPFDMLTAVTEALPEKLWLQRMEFKDQAIELSGRGASDQEAIRIVSEKGIPATSVRQDAPAEGNDFQIRIELVRSTPATDQAKGTP